MSLLDYALNYVAHRLPVFPCCWPDYNSQCGCGRGHEGRNVGKVPLTPNGLNDATIEPNRARGYWQHWPQANIGIAVPPGYFILDCDIEHNGFYSLARMERELDFDLTPTWLVTTGSGGHHYYYKTDKPIRNTTGLGGYEGLDIRGVGGYVVAPPSMHRCGECYEASPVWDGEITLAPSKLINLCLKSSDSVNSSQATSSAIYQEGQRNDQLTRDAGVMRRRGLSQQAIYAALDITNNEKCSPPLPNSEVRLIAKSVSRYEPQEPKKRMGVDLK